MAKEASVERLSAWQASNPREKKTNTLRIGLIIAASLRVDRHACLLAGKIREI